MVVEVSLLFSTATPFALRISAMVTRVGIAENSQKVLVSIEAISENHHA